MNITEQPRIERPTDGFSRRDLIRVAALSAGGAVLLGADVTARAATTSTLAKAAARIALQVDEGSALVRSVEGGNTFADVLPEPPTEDLIQHKRPGAVRYDDLLVDISMTAMQPLAGWITATLAKGPVSKNGAIVYSDFNNNEVKRLEFFNAVITEITLPACDAAGKDPVYLTLRLAPESTRLVGPSGKANPAALAASTKFAMAGSFRLNIQGLEPACTRISKVSAISATRALVKSLSGGEKREMLPRQFAALDCSTLSITLPEQDAGLFYAWLNDFVIKGNSGPKSQRAGRLEWLNPANASTVFTADLGNLGIVRYAPLAASTAMEVIARVQVDMFCETMSLSLAAP